MGKGEHKAPTTMSRGFGLYIPKPPQLGAAVPILVQATHVAAAVLNDRVVEPIPIVRG